MYNQNIDVNVDGSENLDDSGTVVGVNMESLSLGCWLWLWLMLDSKNK